MVVANEEIKRVTLEYCVKNLENGSPDPEVEQDATIKRQLHDMRMKDSDDDDFNIGLDDLNSVLHKFSTKSTNSYDLLLKAGSKYKDAMFKLCKSMIEKEEFSSSFRRTLLNMIWKRKGLAEILSNNRFIHTKESFLPRTCEALATNKMKQRISKCQKIIKLGASLVTLKNFFWRVVLKVPESCPKVALKSETGMVGIKCRLWEQKILLLMRIRNHSEDTLCKQIYLEGELNNWPGLGQSDRHLPDIRYPRCQQRVYY